MVSHFFGTDVKAALQNLPAEVIESIQIYDRLSDKAALSGFDDGEQEKTINIVTNPEHRKGQFGKMTGGYGSDDRYLLGMSLNAFNNNQRITVSGLSNNINAVDYSGEPNSLGNTRPQDGIIKTNSFGLNFSDSWGDKIEFTSSYQYRDRTNLGNSSLVRNYLLEDGAGQRYTEQNSNSRRNREHEFDLRFEYDLDSNNRILVRSDLSAETDLESSFFQGITSAGTELINQTNNTRIGDNTRFDFTNNVYYSRKFKKKGRSFTLGLYTGNHVDEDDGFRKAENIFYALEGDRAENLNQNIILNRTGTSWEVDFSYTEPLGQYGMVELEYEIGNRIDDSDQRTLNILEDEFGDIATFALDTALSNTFKSNNLLQEAEIGYQYNREKFKMQVEAEIQHISLNNDQQFPREEYLERSFTNILPSLRIDYLINSSRKLEFDYHNYTNTPSVGELQNAVDNSNPIQLRSGNPDLIQSFTYQFRIRYSSTNAETDHSFFGFIRSSFEENRISSSSLIADSPIDLGDGIILERGAQLTRPVNLDGYWDLRSYANYGMPVDWIKSNMNLNVAIEYTKRPGLINNEVNFVNSARLRGGINISSNISDRVDFNISTRSTYNLVDNSLRPNLNNNYFNQNTRISYNWIIWRGLVYRLEMSHQLNTGLAEGFDNSFLLVNMSLGKKSIQKRARGNQSEYF
ncbi:outer membrane beta-barrel protein [Algoriphagus boritolerans]|uniref:outer membrane beta-barrel protein n=1 Tax=Algoriphagus boritolerans TaxID=308111 RepID=UPI000A7158B6